MSGVPTMKLEEVCTVVNGGTPRTGVAEFWDGEFAWVTPAEMGKRDSPFISQTRRTLTAAGVRNSSATMLPAGSVILSTRAPIGHLVLNEVPMATNQGCRGLIPGPKLKQKYLYYFLLHSSALLESLGSGTTFKELSAGKLKSIPIPVPVVKEQERIVAILDKALALVDSTERDIRRVVELERTSIASYQDRAFATLSGNSKVRQLGDVAEFRNGVNFTNASKGATVQIVGVADFGDRLKAPATDLASVTIDGHFNPADLLKKDDILSVRSNGNLQLIGRTMIAEDLPAQTTFSGFTIRTRIVSTDLLPEYVCRLLRSPSVRRSMISSGNGANIKNLNQTTLASIQVPVPPRSVQRELLNNLGQLESEASRFIANRMQKLESTAALKQSLLHAAFSGSL